MEFVQKAKEDVFINHDYKYNDKRNGIDNNFVDTFLSSDKDGDDFVERNLYQQKKWSHQSVVAWSTF